MTAYQASPYDLSPLDGPTDGWILDSVMQELNITSSKLSWCLMLASISTTALDEPIFTWIASEHVNATECYNTFGTGGGSVAEAFDYFVRFFGSFSVRN